jgi:ribonucleoside-diphosphate reductase alpha chain
VTIDEHVKVLATAARLVDSAVSKTCNVDGSLPWADFKGVYDKAWELGCKGITTYNADGRRGAVLVSKDDDKKPEEVAQEPAGLTCEIDPASGRRSCE